MPTHRFSRLARALGIAAFCLLWATPATVATASVAEASAHGLHAAASTASDAAAGTITGSLINGTHAKASVAGQKVTLQVEGHSGARDLASQKTDSRGQFTFTGVPEASTSLYAVYTRFQGGLYTTGPIQLNSSTSGTQHTTLTVYDATTDSANLKIRSATVLVRQPAPTYGLLSVGEFVVFDNTGKTAYVGSVGPSGGMPTGLLRFALPAGSTNLTMGVGFVGAQVIQTEGGFGATATVPPGTTEFAFAFDASYHGTTLPLPVKFEYPAARVTVLVPPDIFARPGDFTAAGINSSLGTQYQTFTKNSMATNATANMQLWHLPVAGEPTYLDTRWLYVLVTALALLIAGMVGLYLRRGPLAALVRSRSRHAASVSASNSYTNVLDEIVRLERARDAGEMPASEFARAVGPLRDQARSLLAGDAVGVAAGMDRPVTAVRGGES